MPSRLVLVVAVLDLWGVGGEGDGGFPPGFGFEADPLTGFGEVPKFPGTRDPNGNQVEAQFDMSTLFREIRGINCNISDMRGQIDSQFTHLRHDMNSLRDELTQLKSVSTARFEELGDRVTKLE